MYNRYIPQPDGSYRRSRMPDPEYHRPTKPPIREEICVEQQQDDLCKAEPEIDTDARPASARKFSRSHSCRVKKPQPAPSPNPCASKSRKNAPPCEEKDTSVSSFFRQLLPKDFDTGDLLVVLLLLLMSGDCTEDQNSALLTLVLYLFM